MTLLYILTLLIPILVWGHFTYHAISLIRKCFMEASDE